MTTHQITSRRIVGIAFALVVSPVLAVAGIGTALAASTTPTPPIPTARPTSSVGTAISPSVAAGHALPLRATGFAPGARVEVALACARRAPSFVLADRFGEVTLAYVVPTNTPSGKHLVSLYGPAPSTATPHTANGAGGQQVLVTIGRLAQFRFSVPAQRTGTAAAAVNAAMLPGCQAG